MSVESSNVGAVEETVQGWQDGIEGRIKGLQTGSYARNPEDGKKALQARVQADCDSLWNRYAGARINRIRDAVGDGHLVA